MLKPDGPPKDDDHVGVIESSVVMDDDHVETVNVEPSQAPLAIGRDESLEASLFTSVFRGKIGYFVMYTGFSASPYYGLLLDDKGFAPSAIGQVVAFMPFCVFALLPPLSYIADRYLCTLIIQVIGAIGSTIMLLLATFFSSRNFIAMFMILHFVFRTPVGPFMDQRTMAILPPDRKAEWGSMRSYGAYGWAFGAILSSLFLDWFGWWALGLLYAVGVSISVCVSSMLGSQNNLKRATMNYWGVLRYVALHVRLVVFLSALCFMGLGYSLISTFLFIFLKTIGAPTILLGFSVVMSVVVEIPLFQYSKYIHAHATDRQLLCLSMWAWAARVAAYSYLCNPWLVLFIEPLHGLTFGFMWLSGVHFVRQAFPSSLSCSSIGFLSAVSFGVGPLIGNVIGGALYQKLGGRWMFRLMAVCMLVVSAVFLLLDRYFDRRGHKIEAAEEEGVVESVAMEHILLHSPAEEREVVEEREGETRATN